MPKELIPVVDKNDRVLLYLPSKLIHTQELRHREIAVYLINAAKQTLVQQRDGGYLDHSVAGHVRKGETYLQAALREIKEEIRLRLKPRDLKRLGKFYHRTLSPQKGYYNDRFFALYVVRHHIELQDVHINKHEMDGLEPMSINKIKTLMKEKPKQCKGGFLVSFPIFLKYYKV
ncbi:NUDIX domain-containing protein [Candidatus Uhrbacteria bacterium]|nr:NUDIX domain-containing protein [Candidatus Uhrbacteria bacterium]